MGGSKSHAPRALVMTAGLGTRLRPLTQRRAKAAVPVNGVPLVRRVIRWLAAHEIRDLVLNLHHQPASITAQIGDCDRRIRRLAKHHPAAEALRQVHGVGPLTARDAFVRDVPNEGVLEDVLSLPGHRGRET